MMNPRRHLPILRKVLLLAVVPAFLCVLTSAAACATSASVEHHTPRPSAVVYVDAAGESVSLDEDGSAYEAAWDALDSLADQSIDDSGIWPENSAIIAQPRSDAELIEGLAEWGVTGDPLLSFVFPQGTWLAFRGDKSVTLPGAADMAQSGMGTPLRPEGGGTAYHVRVLHLFIRSTQDGSHPFVIYAEGSEPLEGGGYYSGFYLQDAGSGVGGSVREFLDTVEP